MWDTSFTNELGRLYQEVNKGTLGPNNQRVTGTSTLCVISYDSIPNLKRSDICHTQVVCKYCTYKDNLHQTRITLAGGHICVPSNVSTPTGTLKIVKLMITNALS
jgi:hypothetical protein